MIRESEHQYLRRCVELAREALAAGDEPFGSVLVDAKGKILAEDRNRVAGGDETRHPEFELARWAANHMTPADRAGATVYTSGEHCPMCAAAHGWVGLGRIVYAVSSKQLLVWLGEIGVAPPPVHPFPAGEIAPHVTVEGPGRYSPRKCGHCISLLTRSDVEPVHMESSVVKEIIEVPVLSAAVRKIGLPLSLVTKGAGLVFVSGTPPLDIATGALVKGDIEVQTEAALKALKHCLAAAGTSPANVLMVRIYAANAGFYSAINRVYARHFSDNPPARTFVPVASWPMEFDLEIEAVAVA